MKYLLFTLALVVAGSTALSAQKKHTVVVKSETSYEKLLPADMLYEYSEFKRGKLYYKDGGAVLRDYNFDLLSGHCLFRDKSGTVMEMAFPEQIRVVVIDSCHWYRVNERFGQVAYSKDRVDMIKCRYTKCVDVRKEGAFGGVSSTSSVTNVTSFQGSGSSIQSLSVPGEYDFEVKVEYFLKIGDVVELADAKGFRKLFPTQKSKINSILKSRKIDFDKEADIIELIKEITSR